MEFITELSLDSKYLQSCDLEAPVLTLEPVCLVIYGGSGDLATRKLLPTLFELHQQGELPKQFAVIGAGLPSLSDHAYRELMAGACRAALGESFSREKWESFAGLLFSVGGGFDDQATFAGLLSRLRELASRCGNRIIHYLAVPPDVTPLIVANLKALRLCGGEYSTKVVVEKPFGRDRSSAGELNRVLLDAFSERSIYRIDHYLGKETVQNIIFFRFSNTIFEQLWNSRYVDNVQVTVAEDIGVGHRAAFYERTGVVRDILQSHLLQLVALVAMEPPIGFDAELIRDEKVKVFRSIRPLAVSDVDAEAVRGQYGAGSLGDRAVPGYREEERVAPGSTTPTFVAARLAVANWRWAGVPFYVRTGKRLARRVTEICIQFRQPPLRLFGRTCDVLEPNTLVLTIQPEEGILLRFGVKNPGTANQIAPVNVRFTYRDAFSAAPAPPYGKLLLDCMRGDLTLFERQDGIEAMWDVVDPLLERWEQVAPTDFPNYRAGTWGPAASEGLLARAGRRWLTV
jgi:glucose-6-phosphate 1-dehydrogenase